MFPEEGMIDVQGSGRVESTSQTDAIEQRLQKDRQSQLEKPCTGSLYVECSTKKMFLCFFVLVFLAIDNQLQLMLVC